MESVVEMRSTSARWRWERRTVALVPTMGALHAGHISLVEAALAENVRVVVSIFVNPLQFGLGEDFEAYPRTFDQDLEALSKLGADLVVFHPSPRDFSTPGGTTVRVGPLGDRLEGASRPGHFDGVATVITKLFSVVQPTTAYFGQKDAQQLAVVRRLIGDLDLAIEIVACPIVRDLDGLALSSRNAYLDGGTRESARAVFRALLAGTEVWRGAGGRHDAPEQARMRIVAELEAEAGLEVDYVELVDPQTLEPGGEMALVAVRVGGLRLIDNHLLSQPLAAGTGPGRQIRS